MSEYVFRYANGYGCDMSALMDGGRQTVGDYFASDAADHYGTLHEEIVRCRDCEHYYPHGVPTCQRNRECVTGYDINGYYGEWYDGEFYVEPDGFCAWAERRKGGE